MHTVTREGPVSEFVFVTKDGYYPTAYIGAYHCCEFHTACQWLWIRDFRNDVFPVFPSVVRRVDYPFGASCGNDGVAYRYQEFQAHTLEYYVDDSAFQCDCILYCH